jgi:transposase-like protein
MPKKVMQKTKAAAAANNTHTHPLKGGGVVFAACSTREAGGQKTENLKPRDSRSRAGKPADSGCDSETQKPIAGAPRPLSRVESPAEGQHTRKTEYLSQYNAWIAAMSTAERAQATALGVDKPMPPDYFAHGIGLDADLAECDELSYSPDMAAIIDREEAQDPHPDLQAAVSDVLWDVIRRLIGELLDTPNRSLTAECLAAVSGMSYTGDSLSAIARRHGVTRAAVSKRCIELTRKLHLLPSRTMRSLTARHSYRYAQHTIRDLYEPKSRPDDHRP